MTVKANLKVQLLADSVLVAESEDPILWRKVFAAMQKPNAAQADAELELDSSVDDLMDQTSSGSTGKSAKGFSGLAKELNVSVNELKGACDPGTDAPYIHMDAHHWEALKKNTGTRGPNSIAPVALAATLLSLWFRHGDIEGNPTVGQCQEVLGTIDLRDQNTTRSIKNCEWLQQRANGIVINPAKKSQAIKMARAYILKKQVDDGV